MTQPVQTSPDHQDAGHAVARIAELIAEQQLNPDSIDIWKHRMTGPDLVTVADHYEAPIRVSYTADGITPVQASVVVTLATRHTNGVLIKGCWISTDVTDEDLRIFNLHNTECLEDK